MGMPPLPRWPGATDEQYRAALRAQWEGYYGPLTRRRRGESDDAYGARVVEHMRRAEVRLLWKVGLGVLVVFLIFVAAALGLGR